MANNNSPWIAQLDSYSYPNLQQDQQTEITIVGGGISGVVTAYFLLKNTSKKVILVEGYKLAHGATGHNAGQLVSYFERQISSMVQEFGLEMVAKAQSDVNDGWSLLQNIITDCGLKTKFADFTGYAGFQDLDSIIVHLENNRYANHARIDLEPLIVAGESGLANQIPTLYEGLYSIVPHENILSLLETEDRRFIAALSTRKGVMNSAFLTRELAHYLVKTYADRFNVYEHTHINEIILDQDRGELLSGPYKISTKQIVLCTNGFEKFTITNKAGEEIDTHFHYLIRGVVGYMAGFVEEHINPPVAISYLPRGLYSNDSAYELEPYYTLTRRTVHHDGAKEQSLVCVGGPEQRMHNTTDYVQDSAFPASAQYEIDAFIHQTYKFAPKGEISYLYSWHGLMGYTPNGVRLVGFEPANKVLMYNLGCNGVGLLPSIVGGDRIARLINGEELEPSIFDPSNRADKVQ
ncbi:FAD-binding oxidoreductase [candidate division WWE3 bacterium]|nr:FAD-binding oxidoreductase [candidate division WWE3 bacterium]